MTACLAALLLAAASEPTITWTPRRAVLGETHQVRLRVRVPGAAPGAPAPRLRAADGTLGTASRIGPEEWTATLKLPEGGPPLLDIVSAVYQPPGGQPQVGFAALPLRGRATVPVETEPGARVEIDLGGERIGPFTADERGRLAVPVNVPPGLASVRVRATGPGGRTERSVRLRGAQLGRIALEAVPAGPGRLRLEIFVAGGAEPEEVALEADRARISAPRRVAGRRDRFTATADGPPGEVRLRAWITGAADFRDEVSARIAAAPPARAAARPPATGPPAAAPEAAAVSPLPPRTVSLAVGYRAQPGRTGGAEMALALGWPLGRGAGMALGVSALAFVHGAGPVAGARAMEAGLVPEGMARLEIPGAALVAAAGPAGEIACGFQAQADGCAAALGVSARVGLAVQMSAPGSALLAVEVGMRQLVAGGGRAREAGLTGGLGVSVGLALSSPR